MLGTATPPTTHNILNPSPHQGHWASGLPPPLPASCNHLRLLVPGTCRWSAGDLRLCRPRRQRVLLVWCMRRMFSPCTTPTEGLGCSRGPHQLRSPQPQPVIIAIIWPKGCGTALSGQGSGAPPTQTAYASTMNCPPRTVGRPVHCTYAVVVSGMAGDDGPGQGYVCIFRGPG